MARSSTGARLSILEVGGPGRGKSYDRVAQVLTIRSLARLLLDQEPATSAIRVDDQDGCARKQLAPNNICKDRNFNTWRSCADVVEVPAVNAPFRMVRTLGHRVRNMFRLVQQQTCNKP